jgi:Fic family protein
MTAKSVKICNQTFKYNTTDYIQKGLHEFDLNFGGSLSSENIISEEEKKRILVSSIMEEAIASSQIEGAVTTRKKAKEMLRKNKKPVNKSEQMIMNNYLTIKHIVEIKNEPITIDKLFEIHQLITHKTLDDANDEGKYRDNNEVNVVDAIDGEIVHFPPSFEKVPELMTELFHFFNENDDDNFIHPIVKACIIHFLIGYIHPFVDGNGRTARALFYWYLLKSGYWLTEYLSISRLIVKSKTQYALAYLYSETDDNDLTYFIHFKIKIMLSAYDDLKKYLQRKMKEKIQLNEFQRIDNINERQALILKWIYDEPGLTLTVKEIQVRFNISNQTARTDLELLKEMEFIDVKNINKKTKLFFKSDKFETKMKKYTLL